MPSNKIGLNGKLTRKEIKYIIELTRNFQGHFTVLIKILIKHARKNNLIKTMILLNFILVKLTKSSAIILISPTSLKMASKRDFPGPTYCQSKHHLIFHILIVKDAGKIVK